MVFQTLKVSVSVTSF